LHLFEENRRQLGDWIVDFSRILEQPLEQARLHRRYAHALAVHGVEAADGIADGKKAAGKAVEPLEMAPDALRSGRRAPPRP